MQLDPKSVARDDFSLAEDGYDPEEVDRYLRELAGAIAELNHSAGSARAASALAASRVHEAFERAEQDAVEARERAERDCVEIAAGAQHEGQRLIQQAHERVRELEERAQRLVADGLERSQRQAAELAKRASGTEAQVDQVLLPLQSGWLRSACERCYLEVNRFELAHRSVESRPQA